MILVCDEDVGISVPEALQRVGLTVFSFKELGLLGKDDVEWLPRAGVDRWLVFSCNKRMLAVPRERAAMIEHKVGIVFLTSGYEQRASMLRLILNRWDWLQRIDAGVPRPFAFFLSPKGRPTQKLGQGSFGV